MLRGQLSPPQVTFKPVLEDLVFGDAAAAERADLGGDPGGDGAEFLGGFHPGADLVRVGGRGGDAGQGGFILAGGEDGITAFEDGAGGAAFPLQGLLELPQDGGPVARLAGAFDEPQRRGGRPPGCGYFLLGESQVFAAGASHAREPLPVVAFDHAPHHDPIGGGRSR